MAKDINTISKGELASLRRTMSIFYNQLDQMYNENNHRAKPIIEVSHDTLRMMAHKDILISGIIKKRSDQIKPFLKQMPDETRKNDTRGYRVVNKETGKIDDKAREYMNFFEDTGFGYDPEREDDLIDTADMLIRDQCSIDQIAIEVRRTKNGKVFDFWVVDGATIYRNKDLKSKYRWVQQIKDPVFRTKEVKAYYTADDLIFDYMNKRSDVRYRGWGYSAVEMSIDLVTTFLFGMNYNRDQFVKDKIPRGFIAVMGDVNPETITSIQTYWYQQMSGYGARFKIPILPSGKEGVGMDFKRIGDSNKDMEYRKLMHMVMALKAMPFGIDLMELGLKLEDHQTIGAESGEPRLQHSKDSGLSSMLMFLESIYNKIQKKVDELYRFEFLGLKNDDKKDQQEVKKNRLETTDSIDEIREEEGKEPYDEEWSKIPLNDKVVQILMASKTEMGGGMGGEDEEYDTDYDEDGVEEGMEEFEEEGTDLGTQAGAGAGNEVEKSEKQVIVI
jgi:hypothetical protein